MRENRGRELICECAEVANPPFTEERRSFEFCDVSAVDIDENLAQLVGRSAGRYVSISFGCADGMGEEEFEEIRRVTSHELGQLALKRAGNGKTPKILVAGLGNDEIVHDSLGARVCSLLKPSPQMAVLRVGTAGQSGLDSTELVRAAAVGFGAELVVVIDSLAAFGESRVGSVIQLTDGGVAPASGVSREGGITPINKESVGLPVIAVGVPTALISEEKRENGYLLVGENVLEICRKISELLAKSIKMTF